MAGNKCERLGVPLLLTPPFNISRMMVDADFSRQARVPLVPYIIENPDTYTRFELARHGQGIAVVSADALPPPSAGEKRDPYPYVIGVNRRPLEGFHTLTWKPVPPRGGRGRVAKSGQAEGEETPEDRLAKEHAKRQRPPSDITLDAHRLFCAAIVEQVGNFARRRQDVDVPDPV